MRPHVEAGASELDTLELLANEGRDVRGTIQDSYAIGYAQGKEEGLRAALEVLDAHRCIYKHDEERRLTLYVAKVAITAVLNRVGAYAERKATP